MPHVCYVIKMDDVQATETHYPDAWYHVRYAEIRECKGSIV
jgi:hypothetical protein